MNNRTDWDSLCWYAIHTHPKQEDRADSNLRVLGVRTFNPKMKERHFNQYTNRPTYRIKPLFPGYMFAQLKINDLYHKIRYTRGVHSFVSSDSRPIAVDDAIITTIQSRIKKEDGLIMVEEELTFGDEVIIESGPLKNFVGIFERQMKDSDRVRILLQAISYQAHVEVERITVKKLDRSSGDLEIA